MSLKNLLTKGPKTWSNLKVNSIEFTGSDDLFSYESETIAIRFKGAWFETETLQVKIVRSGDLVNISLPKKVKLTDVGGRIVSLDPIPLQFRPTEQVLLTEWVQSSTREASLGGFLLASDGIFTIFDQGNKNFRSAQDVGWWKDIAFSYNIGTISTVPVDDPDSTITTSELVVTEVIQELVAN